MFRGCRDAPLGLGRPHWVVCFLSGRGGVRVGDVDSTGECRDLEQLLMRQESRKGWRADVLTHGALA